MKGIGVRRVGCWIAVFLSAAVGGPAAADRDGPLAAAERFAVLLEARDADGLAALYHRRGGHRDLASGRMVHGADALRDLYATRLATKQTGRVRIDSFRRLTDDVAIAQLSVTGLPAQAPPGGVQPWPPFTALVVSREDGRWGIAASRAGGNPDG